MAKDNYILGYRRGKVRSGTTVMGEYLCNYIQFVRSFYWVNFDLLGFCSTYIGAGRYFISTVRVM